MPNMPLVVTPIETYMPSIDERNSQGVHVIDGKNFLFDSKGPKSGFGSDILTPFPFSAPVDLQGVQIQGRTFTMTQDAILEWRDKMPAIWDLVMTFDSPVVESQRLPWSAIYLDGASYFGQLNRGVYQGIEDDITGKLVFTQVNAMNTPGFPDDVRAMASVRNRMIAVTQDAIYWSNTGELDFTPQLGGAGMNFIDTFTKGTFVALTEYDDGFTVWTTEGSVQAEFIDGDAVWRFFPGTSLERPMTAWATLRLASGVHVFLNEHGLFISQMGQDPQPWTPEFNEFLSQYMLNQEIQGAKWRLVYDFDRQVMYVMESMDNVIYRKSFVLTPTRNKWGMFNVPVYGMLNLTESQFGYAGMDGIPRYFIDGYFMLDAPPNEWGYDRHFPAHQKTLQYPSSSVVSRALVFNDSSPTTTYDIQQAGWFAPGSDLPAGQAISSLDSWIEFGYIRAPQLSDSIDSFFEIQEIVYGSAPEAAPALMDFTTMWKGDYFYVEEEDWDETVGFIEQDIQEDWMAMPDQLDDWLFADTESNEDWMYLIRLVPGLETTIEEDWNLSSGDEDWDGPTMALNELSSKMTILSSQDGRTAEEYVPELARFDTESRTLVLMAGGHFHRVRLEANAPYEYFHVKFFGVTFEYGGQLV